MFIGLDHSLKRDSELLPTGGIPFMKKPVVLVVMDGVGESAEELGNMVIKATTPTLDELKAKDFLYTMDMFPSENFIVNDDGLTFIYNPYEIAPYDKGRTEIKISFDEAEKIMR